MASKRETDAARGERIRYVRTTVLKMKSQEALASALRDKGKTVTRGAVGNWELGKEVGLDSLTAICDLAGIDLNWLAFDRGARPGATTATEDVEAKSNAASIDRHPGTDPRVDMAIRLADIFSMLVKAPIETQKQIADFADARLKPVQAKLRETATKQAS